MATWLPAGLDAHPASGALDHRADRAGRRGGGRPDRRARADDGPALLAVAIAVPLSIAVAGAIVAVSRRVGGRPPVDDTRRPVAALRVVRPQLGLNARCRRPVFVGPPDDLVAIISVGGLRYLGRPLGYIGRPLG